MFVLDSHCDTPSQLLKLRDLSKDNSYAHVDFPKMLKGKVDGAFFALYIPARYDDDYRAGMDYAKLLLDNTREAVNLNSDIAAFALSSSDAYSNKENGLVSIFLGLENASPIGDSLDNIKYMYDSGVRYMTLCHSGDNQICDSCSTVQKRWGGLSPFGREVVSEMNRLGMLIDVSHASDDTFYDVLKYSDRPVVATHSCCRALCNHPRNMTDDMIRSLAAAGGVIQINFYPMFLSDGFAEVFSRSGLADRGERIESEFIADPSNNLKRAAWNKIQDEIQSLPRPSYELIADHIDHVVRLVGFDHVGIGSDFDGIEMTPDGMENISMMPKLFDLLRSRGYSEHEIEKMAGLNFFRILG